MALIQPDGCPYREGTLRHRHTDWAHDVRSQEKTAATSQAEGPQEALTGDP